MTSQFPTFRLTVQRQMEDYRARLAARIVDERERQGLGQRDLAYKADISEKQLGRIEQAKSDPRNSTLRKIAAALEVQVSDIKPDPEAEEQVIRDQLDRIEARLANLINELRGYRSGAEYDKAEGLTGPEGEDLAQVDAELDRQESEPTATDEADGSAVW